MRALRALPLAVLASLAATSAPLATAADLGPRPGRIADRLPPPIVEAPFTWAGLYVGAHVGYGWSDVDWRDGAFGDHGGEGVLAGGQVGFNMQSGRFVYGIEGDVSSAWIDGGNGCCSHSFDMLYSVRGRLGLASADNRWLFYATGGAAWADIDYSTAGGGRHSDTQLGWVAGGGIERMLTPRLTARVEYLYYDFDSISAPPGTLGASATDLDPSAHTVRFGLNLKFP